MSERADTIGIVGAGPFGLALAAMLGRVGRRVLLLSQTESVVKEIQSSSRSQRMPDLELSDRVGATSDPEELAQAARFLVLAVSSTTVRERLAVLGDVVDGSHIAVHAIGALAAPSDERISRVISEETPILRTGVLAGPSMAVDIVAGRLTSMICASQFDEVTTEGRRLLSVPQVMRLYRGHDLVGVELAAALSGAYTIALGMADGMAVGIGTRAVLLTRAVAEMSRLGAALGADPTTFGGLAGLGNLLVRSSVEDGRQSPSYRLGLALVAGKGTGDHGEGARAARAGLRMARRCHQRMPVLEVICGVLDGEMSAQDAAERITLHVAEEE